MRTAVLVFTLALLLRLLFLSVHPPALYVVGDMRLYEEIAARLLAGASTPFDTFLPVGYPALLALVRALGGSYGVIGALQASLGALAAALASLTPRARATGALAGALVALHPILIFYTGFLLTETLFSACVAALVLVLTRALERPTRGRFVFAGLALGLGAIVRPNLLACALTLPMVMIPVLRRSARMRRGLLAMALAALPILAIPCARNTVLLGRLAGLSTNGGVNFFLGHAPYAGVSFHPGDPIEGTSVAYNRARFTELLATDLHAYDSGAFFRMGLELYAKSPWRLLDPGPLLEGLGLTAPRPWPQPSYWPGWMGHDSALAAAQVAVTALVVVPALARLARPLALRALAPAALALAIVLTVAGFGHARVRVSFDPALAVLAAGAFVWAWRRVKGRGGPGPGKHSALKSRYVRRDMPAKRSSARGFSLVELMNFLALAALLATLGMYGLARYVRHSKTVEAVGNVTAIAEAAALFYNQSDARQPAGTRPEQAKAMRHFPPPSRQTVPADPEDVRGKKYQSTIGDWSVSPWLDMQFKITTPQCYAYGFESQGAGQAAQASVVAHGDLDGNRAVSTYRMTIAPNDQLEALVSPNLERVDPEE